MEARCSCTYTWLVAKSCCVALVGVCNTSLYTPCLRSGRPRAPCPSVADDQQKQREGIHIDRRCCQSAEARHGAGSATAAVASAAHAR